MKKDIHQRIYQLVLNVLRLIRVIPKTAENLVIIKQLLRSITSTGANDQEADGAESKEDFVHKYSIVRKEAKESFYWLTLLRDLNPRLKIQIDRLLSEIQEIINIVSAIIKNTLKK